MRKDEDWLREGYEVECVALFFKTMNGESDIIKVCIKISNNQILLIQLRLAVSYEPDI